MFNDVGKKLMSLAQIIAAIVIALGCVVGLSLLMLTENAFMGFIIIVLGVLWGWLSGVLLYAFGQLVDDTHTISENTNTAKQHAMKIEGRMSEKTDI